MTHSILIKDPHEAIQLLQGAQIVGVSFDGTDAELTGDNSSLHIKLSGGLDFYADAPALYQSRSDESV